MGHFAGLDKGRSEYIWDSEEERERFIKQSDYTIIALVLIPVILIFLAIAIYFSSMINTSNEMFDSGYAKYKIICNVNAPALSREIYYVDDYIVNGNYLYIDDYYTGGDIHQFMNKSINIYGDYIIEECYRN